MRVGDIWSIDFDGVVFNYEVIEVFEDGSYTSKIVE